MRIGTSQALRPVVIAASALVLGVCAPAPRPAVPVPEPGGSLLIPPLPLPPQLRGQVQAEPLIDLTLTEAPAPAGVEPRGRGPSATPLPDAAAAALLARLPAVAGGEQRPFRFPAASPPPPRAGRVVVTPLAAPERPAPARPEPVSLPLRVERVLPAGETEQAAHVTITFNQPMVPLTTIAGTDARGEVARLSPQPDGRWIWQDVRTLRFVPAHRLPMATRFVVDVPAGTAAATGAVLAEAVRVEFATPAPRAVGGYPALPVERDGRPDGRGPWPQPHVDASAAGSVALQPIMLVRFDQAIDAARILSSVRLLAAGRDMAVRLATADEIAADSMAAALIATAAPERWLALKPVEPLPRGAEARLVIGAGAPSAEGPLLTSTAQEMRFRTFGPLRIAQHDCWGREACPPGSPWTIRFSNPIAEGTWSDTLVSVTPALPNMRMHLQGALLQISGEARPNTVYRVSLSAAVRDAFGQRLDAPRTVTFRVGAAAPAIAIAGEPLVVLDPDGPQRVRLGVQGLRAVNVTIYRVTPADWPAYAAALQQRNQRRGRFMPPGQEVVATTVEPAAGGAGFGEVHVDVSPALVAGLGHAVVVAEPVSMPPFSADWERPVSVAWVQSTRIGLTAVADGEELLVWATSLSSGAALAGVAVDMIPGGAASSTGPDGLARLPLGAGGQLALVASSGVDTALLPNNEHGHHGAGWGRMPPTELRWFVFSDRGIYQPGETVQLKGWLRQLAGGRGRDVALPDVGSVTFRMRGPRGEDIASGAVRPGQLGGFHTAIELPEALNLGHTGIELQADMPAEQVAGLATWHRVQVQEFRRPDHEVVVAADPGPHLAGDSIDVALEATYFGGGGLGGARVAWRVTPRPAHYAPAGWPDWRFGREQRWGPWYGEPGASPDMVSLEGETDGAGRHRVRIGTGAPAQPFPVTLETGAEVQDITHQVGSAGVSLLVHPAAVNVGLRLDRSWALPGQPLQLGLVVVDHDGRALPGRAVTVTLERVEWTWRAGHGEQIVSDAGVVCTLLSGDGPATCTLRVAEPGSYRLKADATDDGGRLTRTELSLWIAGGRPGPGPRDPGQLELRPDREEYQPGDTARILITAPFHPAEALLTLRRAGVVRTERFVVDSATHALRVPVTEEHVGGVSVRVDLVDRQLGTRHAAGETVLQVPPHRRALEVLVTPAAVIAAPGGETTVAVQVRDADGRPAAGAEVALWMVDEAVLSVGGYRLDDPLQAFYAPVGSGVRDFATRQWIVSWPRSAGPGTVSGIVVDGATGQTVAGALVRLEGTDLDTTSGYDGSFTLTGAGAGEFVLQVELPGGARAGRTISVPAEGVHLGNVVAGAEGQLRIGLQEKAAEMTMEVAALATAPPPPMPAPAMARQALQAGDAGAAVAIRADFAPLAFFEPSLRTGADGRVQVPVRLPHSLTRYRIMAVAVAGARQFGTGEATLTARQDLMVRITAPRFLNFGDRVQLPVLVQNSSAETLTVSVAARATGLQLVGPVGQRVALPPGERAELLFEGAAAHAGTAAMDVIAVAGERTDAASVQLPVYTPATLEAFATYGQLDSDAPVLLPVAAPTDIIAGFGGIDVSITSTALHALTDALLHLRSYPFEGAEQIASRVLAVAALRDVLAAFGAQGLPSPQELDAATEDDIARLATLQNADGGWGFWRAGEASHPFVSAHVAHALQRAGAAGFSVPPAVLSNGVAYLRTVDRRTGSWPVAARQAVEAYALYVRHAAGDPAARAEALRLAGTPPEHVGGGLPVEAAAWLLAVLAGDPAGAGAAAELRRFLLNRLEETPSGATFTESWADGGEHLVLHSRRRTDAVVLEALILAEPGSDVIPRLATSLLAHRVSGRWQGTQENAWVLLALNRYFRTYEANVPDFLSRVWLAERFAGEHAFRGRSTDRQHLAIPMAELVRADTAELLIARQGTGRMYYRAGLRYAPAEPRSAALARGFEVSRTYEAVDDAGDVSRAADGTWLVARGARLRVVVTMIAPAVRHHVALMDPLPAGLEPLNPELRGTGLVDDAVAGRAAGRLPVAGGWFSHQNLRDDRAEAFAGWLPAGVHTYSYMARATTAGTFAAPPTRAEMMYAPETFGRGAGEVLVVR